MKHRRLTALALALSPLTALPAPPAHAAPPAAVDVVGTASMPVFPCEQGCTGGTFRSNVVVGADSGGVIDRVTATFRYRESCYVPVGAGGVTANEPLVGVADGTMFFWRGSDLTTVAPFHWERNGLVATISGGALGIALFVPLPLPACGGATSVNATVAGSVVVA